MGHRSQHQFITAQRAQVCVGIDWFDRWGEGSSNSYSRIMLHILIMPSPEQGTMSIQEFVAIADSDSAQKPLFSLNQQIASSPKKGGTPNDGSTSG